MTKELLWPRYKVIADYPGNNQAVGTIIQLYEATNAVVIEQMYFYDKYPYLFQKLEWWMDRKSEDMPEYVKWNKESIPEHGRIEKVIHAELTWTMGIKVDSQVNHVKAEHFLPATAAEYEVYQATLKQQ